MENLLFVLWLLCWPLVCSVTDRISPWEGTIDPNEHALSTSIVAATATIRIFLWLGVAVLLYRQ